jgi:hypothetical protein
MVWNRTSPAVLALSFAVLLAGCGDSTSPSGAGPEVTTPAVTQAPRATSATVWAGGVCAASRDLRESVRAGQALQIDPANASTSLDQAKAQVRDRVAAVQQSATALGSALSAVPTDADPAVTAARQQLQADADRAKAAADQLGAAASQVAQASSAVEVAAGLVPLKAALTGTANDVETYLESLRGTVGSREQPVRDAFGAAPACQDLAASATATASP